MPEVFTAPTTLDEGPIEAIGYETIPVLTPEQRSAVPWETIIAGDDVGEHDHRWHEFVNLQATDNLYLVVECVCLDCRTIQQQAIPAPAFAGVA